MSSNQSSLCVERGASTVEHAIALPLFCFLVFSILDICGACYNQLSLQFTASKVMRTASLTPGMSESELRSEVSDRLGQLGVRLAVTDRVTLCPVDDYLGPNCPENTVRVGQQRELMVLHIRKSYSTVVNKWLPNVMSLEAQVLGRNEPI